VFGGNLFDVKSLSLSNKALRGYIKYVAVANQNVILETRGNDVLIRYLLSFSCHLLWYIKNGVVILEIEILIYCVYTAGMLFQSISIQDPN
jgi:hypothetical protein